MSLVGARFRGVVLLSKVRLINPEGTALNASSMSASDVVLEDAHLEGEVRLLGATLSGQLGCREGTKLINPEGTALQWIGTEENHWFSSACASSKCDMGASRTARVMLVRVMLVEDYLSFREVLAFLLRRELEVVAQARLSA
jgi:hypothetical protein